MHLPPSPLGLVVALYSDSVHLFEVDVLATRQKVHEFARWLADLPAGTPEWATTLKGGGGGVIMWFFTKCVLVLTWNFFPSALGQSLRFVPGG